MPAAWVGAAAAVIGAGASMHASNQAKGAQNRATAAQESIQQQQMDLAHEQYDRYKSTYAPLEDEFTNEARDYGSEANRQKAAEEAGGDVASSYAGLRSQLASTPGLDPSSQKYLDTIRKLGVSQAAQTSAAETGARRNVDSQGIARMQDAVSIGKGLPGNSVAALGSASVSANSLNSMGLQQAQQAGQNAQAIGKMVGGIASTPGVVNAVKGWFTTPGGMDMPAPINESAAMPAYSGTAGNVAATIPSEEVFSDIRLKTEICQIGVASNGLALYSYRYLWGGAQQIGHMAQEVAAVFPDAVRRHPSGFLMVDYSKV